jgi:hypothetical protein
MSEPKPKGKSFAISKWVVWESYQRVKANDGAAGVDGESIEDFERDLKGNLYKLWNRLSSGSYFPAPVRAVEIPKKHGQGRQGGFRVLGVPTVTDCDVHEPTGKSVPEHRSEPGSGCPLRQGVGPRGRCGSRSGTQRTSWCAMSVRRTDSVCSSHTRVDVRRP